MTTCTISMNPGRTVTVSAKRLIVAEALTLVAVFVVGVVVGGFIF